MGRQRGFLPPAQCQQCEKPPELGQTLWPGNKWRCLTCLGELLPGKDSISKSAYQMMEYRREFKQALAQESEGAKADEPRNRAEWARRIAAEISRQGQVRSEQVTQAHGEALPPD